jgi:hypothetical protein
MEMEETLPDPAISQERQRLVKPGPDAQSHAHDVGERLSALERKRKKTEVLFASLRTIYEMDCAELGLVATRPELGDLVKSFDEELARRERLVTARLLRVLGRGSISNVEEAIRRKSHRLTYRTAPKEKEYEDAAGEGKEESGVRTLGDVERLSRAEQPAPGRAPAGGDPGRDGEGSAAPGADPGPLSG